MESKEITPESEVLRIVLMGLPYSGIQEVALTLKEVYGCTIVSVNLREKPKNMTDEKYVRNIVFQYFLEVPKAVIILDEYHSNALRELKKRNYVNFVHIDAPFRTRYHYYIQENTLPQN